MQRIFHYDKIQNTSLIPDKILNILIYGGLSLSSYTRVTNS